MRVWYANFPGHWLGGDAVIVADTEERARELLVTRIQGSPLTVRPGEIDLSEIDASSEGVRCFYDGDY